VRGGRRARGAREETRHLLLRLKLRAQLQHLPHAPRALSARGGGGAPRAIRGALKDKTLSGRGRCFQLLYKGRLPGALGGGGGGRNLNLVGVARAVGLEERLVLQLL